MYGSSSGDDFFFCDTSLATWRSTLLVNSSTTPPWSRQRARSALNCSACQNSQMSVPSKKKIQKKSEFFSQMSSTLEHSLYKSRYTLIFFQIFFVDRRQRIKLPRPAFFLQAHSEQAFASVLGIEVAPHALACVPRGGVTNKRRCTHRPSVIYLIVNKLLSLVPTNLPAFHTIVSGSRKLLLRMVVLPEI